MLSNSSMPVTNPEVEKQAKAFVSQAHACMAGIPTLKSAAGKRNGCDIELEGTYTSLCVPNAMPVLLGTW